MRSRQIVAGLVGLGALIYTAAFILLETLFYRTQSQREKRLITAAAVWVLSRQGCRLPLTVEHSAPATVYCCGALAAILTAVNLLAST